MSFLGGGGGIGDTAKVILGIVVMIASFFLIAWVYKAISQTGIEMSNSIERSFEPLSDIAEKSPLYKNAVDMNNLLRDLSKMLGDEKVLAALLVAGILTLAMMKSR